jgi:fucose 4-O-acetylase-like acetyltransferase
MSAPNIAPRSRDPYLDNARGLLIILVVVGHTLECFDAPGTLPGGALYTAIYSFHMAAFVMISGYLSRSYRNEPRQVRRLLTAMVVPYVIFQLVHEAGRALLLGDDFSLQLVEPAWTLWFLLALMLWRLATPALRCLRHPLVIAVAISVIAPLDQDLDGTFTLGRIAGMLPFFVLGLVCTPELVDRLRAGQWRWLGMLAMLGSLVCAFLLQDELKNSWFYLRDAFPEEGSVAVNIFLRLLVLAAGVIGALGLLLLSPRGNSLLTVLGTRSLTIYLLHPVLLLPVRYAEKIPDWPESWWGTLLLVLIATALTLVLGSSPISRLTRWVTDPPIGHLLVREDPPAPRTTAR